MIRLRFILPIALIGCANPVVPTGGVKDNTAPRYTYVTIEHKQDHTNVHFIFNEQVTASEADKYIILSPATLNSIATTTGQHTITIKITNKEPLKPTSYIQLLGGWAKDLNEKNPIDSTPFIFLNPPAAIKDSTVFGGSLQCINNCKEAKLKLFLLKSINPNFNLNGSYFTRPNKLGNFQFPSFTRTSETKYLLLNDINANNQIDSNEYYNLFLIPSLDSLDTRLVYCPEIRTINPRFDINNKTLRISGLKGATIEHPQFFTYHIDTGYLFLQDSTMPELVYDNDLNAHRLNPNKTTFRTSAQAYKYESEDSALTILLNQAVQRKMKNTVNIIFNDTFSISKTYTIEYPNKLIIHGIPSRRLTIELNDSSFIDINNSLNNALSIDVEPSKINFGTLNISKSNTDTNQYIIYLKQQDNYTKYIITQDNDSFTIKNLTGNYDLIIVRDQDLNLTYTRANIKTLIPEEQVAVLKNIVISDKMENTINLESSRLFTHTSR